LEESKVILVDGLQVNVHSLPVDFDNLLDFLAEFQKVHVVFINEMQKALGFGFCKPRLYLTNKV